MANKIPKKKSSQYQVQVAPPSISAAGSQAQATTGGSALASPVKRKPARRSPQPAPSGGNGSGGFGSSGSSSTSTPAVAAPVDPFAPMSLADMIKAATDAATASIQPGLNSIGQDAATAQSAHDTRAQQLQSWADWSQGNLNSAFDDTRNALNQLVTLQGGVDQSSKDALASALRAGSAPTDQAAASLGIASPTNLTPVLSSSADSAKSMELGAGSGAGALLGMMGANRSLPSVGLAQNQDVERQRFNAQQTDFAKQRKDLLGSVPSLVQSNLKDQQAYELSKAQFGEQKANDLFQQYLSSKELDLKTKDQTFQQWLGKQQLNETVRSNKAGEDITSTQNANQLAVDWANVGINKTQAEGTLAQIRADTAKEKDAGKKAALKARGDAIAKGMEWLSGYMAPGKDETGSTNGKYPYGAAVAGSVDDPATAIDESDPKQNPQYRTTSKEYKRTFDSAVRGLTQFMSRSDAMRLLMKSEYSDWRDRASAYYKRMKRRPGSGAAGYSKGNGKPD